MSALPLMPATTEVAISGREVPMATIVKPIIRSDRQTKGSGNDDSLIYHQAATYDQQSQSADQ